MQLKQPQASRENAKHQFRYFCMNKAPFHIRMAHMPFLRGNATQSVHGPLRVVLKIQARITTNRANASIKVQRVG